MYNEQEIEDSLEFCRTAREYYPDFVKDEDAGGMESHAASTWEAGYSVPRKKGWRRPTTETQGLRTVSNLLVLLVCILAAYLIATGVTRFVAHQTWVEGDSMEPTLSDGDSIIIQKITYSFSSPERYDVVVFPVKEQGLSEEDTYYVKRVIGLPGETVQIRNGKVFVNQWELLDDNYCLSEILDAGNAAEPVTLGPDEYFVLGDNRNMSTDSRSDFVGKVHRKDIVGKVCFRIWPLSHWGALQYDD